MLHVLNTRPTERADGLNQALQQAGYPVTALPLLELVAESFSAIQQSLAKIHQVAVVVVVSPAAAQLGLAGLKKLNILPNQLDCQWVAVGQGTAAVLAEAGIKAHIPALQTSEGMLALAVFQQTRDSQTGSLPAKDSHSKQLESLHSAASATVMFWRGYGGRQFMLQQLSSQQHVLSVNLYRRWLPETSRLHYQQLFSQQGLNHPAQVLLISSGVSWQNWLELGKQFGAIIPDYILVLGQRVYQKISQQVQASAIDQTVHSTDSPGVILLESLNPASILAVLDQLQKCQQT